LINIYGSRISYYAGKLETYLRYRSIEYQLLPMVHHAREILAGAGAVQSPTVKLEDGRWLSDTTPILAWFESQREGVSIYPEDCGGRPCTTAGTIAKIAIMRAGCWPTRCSRSCACRAS
jgi:glutathione S-transferase